MPLVQPPFIVLKFVFHTGSTIAAAALGYVSQSPAEQLELHVAVSLGS